MAMMPLGRVWDHQCNVNFLGRVLITACRVFIKSRLPAELTASNRFLVGSKVSRYQKKKMRKKYKKERKKVNKLKQIDCVPRVRFNADISHLLNPPLE